MVYWFLYRYPNVMLALGITFIFITTMLAHHLFKDKLPADEGRDFAVDGKLSKGKPRGAGIIFILCFALGYLLFGPFKPEYIIYVVLTVAEMLTGYLDDRAEKPWGRLKKGILDLVVAILLAFTYVHYNGTIIRIAFLSMEISVPLVLFVVLCILLVWGSVNVTNCADGVDGLSGMLVIVTLLSFFIGDFAFDYFYRFSFLIIFFIVALIAYLWFNAGPSILMMGDAGSRAMGLFIAIVALKSRMPLLFVPFALVLILDGGLGLLKVTCIRVFKFNPLKKIRTPLHDFVRKEIDITWSNPQTVARFSIIQGVISLVYIYLFLR